MTLRDFTDLASLMMRHASHIVESPEVDASRLAEAYWVQARRRHAQWNRFFAEARNADDWAPLIEEFFVADVLSRVWAAILLATAERRREIRGRGLIHQALRWHLEARNVVLEVLTNEWDDWNGRAALLDILRRRTERWTDLLISPLIARYGVEAAGFSLERAIDSSTTFEHSRRHPGYEGLWSLTSAALRASIPNHAVATARIPLQEEFLSEILSALPASAFDSEGSVRGERARRLFQVVDETAPATTWQRSPRFKKRSETPS
ncbi:hypothetical protein [Planctomyces sp. SH-PL14]|uniref:hypothetical protein n=1 Tax=Planctomyces sp. SH-PL14 TaxID=1632864 RepID=UPI00078CBC1F|nr:hypothetical protein [Planctomyces sp. SH-PL14]AMV21030.1 hypothetical protein VT03_24215 [Planctomyces sp. SH-PL14]